MSPRWRHILRRTRFIGSGVVALLIIALAVFMALGQLLVPLAAQYPNRVAAFISQRVGRPVHFASMKGHWQPSGPLLVLHDVRIGGRNGQPAVTLPTAKVKLDFGALFEPHRHWVNLRLSGLKLTLRRDLNGDWHVIGFTAAGAGNGKPQKLTLSALPGNVWLDDLQLVIEDAASGHQYKVHVGPLRVSNGGGELRFAGELRRGGSPRALQVAGQVRDGGVTGRLYLAAHDANFGRMFAQATPGGYAVKSGHGDLALWLSWHERRLTGATVDVNLANFVLDTPVGTVHAPRVQGLLRFQRDGDAAHVLFAPGSSGALRVAIKGLDGPDMQVALRAKNLSTGPWLSLAALAPGLPEATRHWLVASAPSVHLAKAQLAWSKQGGLAKLSAHFDHLRLAAAAGRPGTSHIHGIVRGDGEAVSLTLPSQPLTLDLPNVFAQPLTFSTVGGNMALWHGADAWHVATGGLAFQGKGITGSARGSIRIPSDGGAPVLNLFAMATHSDVKAVPRFLPASVIPKGVMDWLSHGLSGGTIDHARVVLHGNMAHWPFNNHDGHFEAAATLSDLALHYQPNWPPATGIDLSARFVNNGMQAVATAGQVNGVNVTHAVASISDFKRPELVLSARGDGTGSNMLNFVRTSPIGKPHADILDQLKLRGKADFTFSMVVPLSRAIDKPLTLGGTVNLHDMAVDAPQWKLHLGAMNGAVTFDQHGFAMHNLKAVFHGQPVTLGMTMGPQTGHADWPLRVEMRGRFSFAQLAKGRKMLGVLDKLSSGQAPFRIGFHLDSKADNAVHSHQVLTVQSTLRGIALKLPAPMAKPAQALWPLDLEMGFGSGAGRLRVILGNRLYARARLPWKQRPVAVDVRLGGQAPAGPMPASGIRVRGRVANLDISGWVSRALSTVGGIGGSMPALDVNVLAARTHIFGQIFNDLRLKLQQTPKQLAVAIDGPAIQGTVTVPTQDIKRRGIVARFARLYWPHTPSESEPPTAAKKPVPPPTPQQAADVGVAPSSLPPLHILVRDLRYGDARLGQARLETSSTAEGMRIGILRLQSKHIDINATGDWIGTAHASHTNLKLHFTAESLGHLLQEFGYGGFVQGAPTTVQFDASWPGSPYSFALANTEGTLKVNIGTGRIPKVKPSIARLFGLMSITELPRTLFGGGGGAFGKGLGFNSIQGQFHFQDGHAKTTNFVLTGPSLSLAVSGGINLRTHILDLYVLAAPHIGNTLPIVGAVFGGPVGALAGLAVQGLLGKGINHAVSKRYHVTGPWTHPTVTPAGGDAPVQAPPMPATSGASAPAQPTSTGQLPAPAPAAGIVPAPATSAH